MRRAAALLLAVAVLVPGAPARAETTPVQQRDTWLFVDTTPRDGRGPVLRRQVPGGPAPAVAGSPDGRALDGLSTSRDGRLVTYHLEQRHDDSFDSAVVVCRADGTQLGTYHRYRSRWGSTPHDVVPELSPAGSRVVYTSYVYDGPTRVLLSEVATGRTTTLVGSDGYAALVWLTQRWLLALGPHGLVTMSANGGGPKQAVPGFSQWDGQFAVSPDGTRIAWSTRTNTYSNPAEVDLMVGSLVVTTDGVATVVDRVRLATGQANVSPTWSRDGTRLDFVQAPDLYDGIPGLGTAFPPSRRGTVPALGGDVQWYSSNLSVSQVADVFRPPGAGT